MAITIENVDTKGKHAQFASGSTKVDRIICDIPSFANRFPSAGGQGGILDCVNSVIHLIKNSLSEDGTATISVTGDALTRFNAWLDNQSDFEVVPGSEFTTYSPLYKNNITNKQFWTRTANWAYVRTIRKVGSSFTVNWSAWDGIEKVSNGGNKFPMPASRDDITTSAFRLGVHQGILESREYQNWLSENDILFRERSVGDNMEVSGVVEPGHIFAGGTVIAPSDFAQFIHVPKRLYPSSQLSDVGVSIVQNTNVTIDVINERFETNDITLLQYIYTTHSNKGDLILDPFVGAGSAAIAASITQRSLLGWEDNYDRARTSQLVGAYLTDTMS